MSRARLLAALAAVGALAAPAHANREPASGTVDAFGGAYGDAVAIQVPHYYAIAPRLAFRYGSQSPSGDAGVGWNLVGASAIERTTAGRGAPVYTAEDVFVLDGEPLIACPAGSTSPGCMAGATHATTIESRRKIVRDAATDSFTVWSSDGTRSIYRPVQTTAGGTFRWGLREVRDVRDHVASYDWWCDGADACYLDKVRFGTAEVQIYRELRPDPTSAATGRSIATTRYRVRSVAVRESAALVRTYATTYALGSLGRSVLAAIEQRGRDAAIDAAGAVTGGTIGLRRDFTYLIDPDAGTLTLGPAIVATAPGTTEAAVWFKRACATTTAPGELIKAADPGCTNAEWNGGASSTRALTAGTGAATFRFAQWQGATAAGLATDDHDTSAGDIDFAIERGADGIVRVVERGVPRLELGASCCATYRIAVEAGAVRYYRDGVLRYTSTAAPSYPLRLDVAMADNGWSGVTGATLTGELAEVALWCADGRRLIGDFDGDGRGDLACDAAPAATGTRFDVRLGGDDGFGPATTWLHAAGHDRGVGDFDGDGKDDLYVTDLFSGEVSVARSTGAGFAAPVAWGSNGVCRIIADFYWSVGDFNADGLADIACQRTRLGNGLDGIWIGLSTGTSFQHSRWLDACDAANDAVSSGDYDGDGRTDWMCQRENGQVAVFLARPGQLLDAALTGFYLPAGGCPAKHWTPADLNGDGKLDLACAPTGEVRLSTGRGFIIAPAIGAFCAGAEDQLVSADLGGDGMVDWICNTAGAGASDLVVRRGTATGLGAATTLQASWCPGRVTPIDFDGDRKTDLLCDEALQPIGRAGTPGVLADLLAAATTGLGGSHGIAYTPSTRFPNANNPPAQYVVTALATDDGRGTVGVEQFAYEGGLVDRRAGRFLGFRYVRRTLACAEPTCPYVETWNHQGYGSRTQPERVDQRAADAALLRATIYELATDAGVAPYWTRVTGTWRYDYPSVCGLGDPCEPRRTYVAYDYDAWGNTAVIRDHGDVALAGDESRIERAYRPNPAAFVIAAVAAETQFSAVAGGAIARQSLRSYDGAATWDAAPVRGELTRDQDWLDATGGYVARSWTRDANGNVAVETDRLGATTAYAYTPSGRWQTTTTNALGHVLAVSWNIGCDDPATATDANGATTAFSYDALCRLVRVDRPGGDFEIRRYPATIDATSQYVETAGPGAVGGEQWQRSYRDGLGRPYRVTRRGPTAAATIVVEERVYGPGGALEATAAPRYAGDPAAWTALRYDGLGRWIERTGPGGTVRRDHGADSIATIDAGGHVAITHVDGAGRPRREIRITDAGPIELGFEHGPHGLTRVTDADGNQWSWRFDSLGYVRGETDPDRGTITVLPDAEGRTIESIDALGQRTRTARDALGRSVAQTTRFGTAGALTMTYGYDEPQPGAFNVGRLTTAQAPGATTTIRYDAAGRETDYTRTMYEGAFAFHIGYDAGGRMRSLTYADGDTLGTPATPIEYDEAGRTLTLPGVATAIRWFADGTLAGYTAGNGVVTAFSRDAAGRLSRIRAAVPAVRPVLDLSYRRDLDGRIEQIDAPRPIDRWLYAYDDRHRLTDATNLGDPTLSESFAYDDTDNITWTSRLGSIPYPAAGQPRPHGALVLDAAGVAFDASGDLTAGGSHVATWRGDHLPGAVDGQALDYGALFDRTRVGATRIEIGDYYRIDAGVTTKYVPLAGRLIAERVGAARYWLHTDHQHSIRTVTDASGEIVATKRYRPYGGELAGGAFVERKGFTGETRDDSGLLYLHARYYDPDHARFISPDALAPDAGGVGVNRYGFGVGDPVNTRDPSGRLAEHCRWYDYDCWADVRRIYDFGFTDSGGVTAVDDWEVPDWQPDVLMPGDPERPEPRGGDGTGTGPDPAPTEPDPNEPCDVMTCPLPPEPPPSTPPNPPRDNKPKPKAEDKLLEAMAAALQRGIGRGVDKINDVYDVLSDEDEEAMDKQDKSGGFEEWLINQVLPMDFIEPTNEAAGIIGSDVERWYCRPGSAWSCK